MEILCIMNGRAAGACATASSDGATLWPEHVQAISFIVTRPDALAERVVAYAVSADGDGAALYTIETGLVDLGSLLGAIAAALALRRTTGIVPGDPPRPHPTGDELVRQPTGDPVRYQAAIGIAKVSHQVQARFAPFIIST
jgi:hypothetical protein